MGRYHLAVAAALAVHPAAAQDSRISPNLPRFETSIQGTALTVDRNGPPCPPRCIQPMRAAPGVATIGELEVLDFLSTFASEGRGLLLDVRLPAPFASATVAGAVNVPAETLAPRNPYRDDLLAALGWTGSGGPAPFDLVLFGAGPDDPAPVEAVRNLIDAGYPTERIRYYRGGLAVWAALGLTQGAGVAQ